MGYGGALTIIAVEGEQNSQRSFCGGWNYFYSRHLWYLAGEPNITVGEVRSKILVIVCCLKENEEKQFQMRSKICTIFGKEKFDIYLFHTWGKKGKVTAFCDVCGEVQEALAASIEFGNVEGFRMVAFAVWEKGKGKYDFGI